MIDVDDRDACWQREHGESGNDGDTHPGADKTELGDPVAGDERDVRPRGRIGPRAERAGVRLVAARDPALAPQHRTRDTDSSGQRMIRPHGHELSVVLEGLLRPLMVQFAGGYRSEPDFVLADGDRVVVQTRGYATTTRGEPYHQTYCLAFRVAQGRLTEVIEHCDTAPVERRLEPIPR